MARGSGIDVACVKLSPEERAAIRRATERTDGSERRRHRRIPLVEGFPLLVRVDGAGSFLSVTPKDLSSSGIGFFHIAYLHPGTPLHFLMKNRRGEPAQFKGAVMRCRHVSGRVHEVGALFEHEIRVEVFVSVSPESPEPPPDESRMYDCLEALGEQVRALAHERAGLEEIMERVSRLAVLLFPKGETPAAAATTGLAGPAGDSPTPGTR